MSIIRFTTTTDAPPWTTSSGALDTASNSMNAFRNGFCDLQFTIAAEPGIPMISPRG
jgi:hypothetical protein